MSLARPTALFLARCNKHCGHISSLIPILAHAYPSHYGQMIGPNETCWYTASNKVRDGIIEGRLIGYSWPADPNLPKRLYNLALLPVEESALPDGLSSVQSLSAGFTRGSINQDGYPSAMVTVKVEDGAQLAILRIDLPDDKQPVKIMCQGLEVDELIHLLQAARKRIPDTI